MKPTWLLNNPSREMAFNECIVNLIIFSIFFQVVTSVPPQIAPFRVPEPLEEGQRLAIMCAVARGSLPISFSWRKEGVSLTSSGTIKIVHSDDYQETLQILKLSTEHVGNYTCTAKNAYGSDQMPVAVMFKFKPRWNVLENENGAVSELNQDSVNFDCSAIGHPAPDIKVFRGK